MENRPLSSARAAAARKKHVSSAGDPANDEGNAWLRDRLHGTASEPEPEPIADPPPIVDYGGGPRGTPITPHPDMSDIIRRAARRVRDY